MGSVRYQTRTRAGCELLNMTHTSLVLPAVLPFAPGQRDERMSDSVGPEYARRHNHRTCYENTRTLWTTNMLLLLCWCIAVVATMDYKEQVEWEALHDAGRGYARLTKAYVPSACLAPSRVCAAAEDMHREPLCSHGCVCCSSASCSHARMHTRRTTFCMLCNACR